MLGTVSQPIRLYPSKPVMKEVYVLGTVSHLSNREQFKEGNEEADRGNDGKTTPKSGLVLNGAYYYGKLRTARSGGS